MSVPQLDLFANRAAAEESVRQRTAPLVHARGLATERAALAKVAPTILPMRERIHADVAAAGDYGCTPDDWAARNRALINTVRRRFTDLWKAGLIRHHPNGETRRNAAGNPCVIWIAGKDPTGEHLASGTRCPHCGALRRNSA